MVTALTGVKIVPPSELPKTNGTLILNIDDTDAIRYARSRTLAQAGYHVIEASTGEEGLLLAAKHRPQLIVLDINLPDIDGLEVCRRIKADHQTGGTMILQVSSARSSKLDLISGLDGGADGYLIEPIDRLTFLATVRALLRLAHRQKENLRLAAIVDSSQDAIIGKDLSGIVTSWNQGATALFGYTAPEMIGTPVVRLIPADRRHEEDMLLARIAQGEKVEPYDTVRVKQNGSRIHVSLTVSPVKDATGRVIGASKIARDITQRTRAEAALRESEERFRRVFEHAPTGIAITDSEGRFEQCNPAYCALLGYGEEELRRLDSASLVHPEDRSADLNEMRRLMNDEVPHFETQNRYCRKDGAAVWVHKFVSVLRSPAGGRDHLVTLVTDVTERRQAEERERRAAADARAAAEANAKFRTFFEQGTNFAGVMALDGTIIEANRFSLEACGFSREGIVGKKFWDCGWWNRSPALMDMVREGTRRAAAGHLFMRETSYFVADGTQRIVDLVIAPIKDEAGRVLFLAPSGTDITERKRQEEELRRWKDELELRVHERTQALSDSQARLRALSSQLAMTEQHERHKLAENLHDHLAQMLVVGQMKTGMVKRQPELSPATLAMIQEAAKVFQQALSYTRTLIGELSPPSFREYGLPAALQWLAEQMQKNGLQVDVRTDAEHVPLSEEQAVLVFQCVRELLFNVLKHAGVQQAMVQVLTGGLGEVRVIVRDRGQGMSEDHSRRDAQPGHLGLFAVRERMASVGGRAEVSSNLGEGTSVTLCLPRVHSEVRRRNGSQG